MATTQIRGAQILDLTVTSADLAADSVITSKILDANVTLAKLAANSVDSSKIVDLSIVAADLAADSVITSKILDANVTAAKLASDSVTTVKILDANVTLAKLAADSVDSSKIVDLSIVAADLAADSVITSKILDANVTAAKLASDSVTTVKILDANVTLAKLAADSVNSSKIVDLSIATVDLGNGIVTVAKLSDLQVTQGAGALTVDVAAGFVRDDNVVTVVAATDELAVVNATTNYVEVSSAGVVSTNTVGFTSSRIPLATVVTAGGVITSINDRRAWLVATEGVAALTNANFTDNETPTGDLDGVDVTYTLAVAPSPAGSLHLYLNGIRQKSGGGNDYTLSGSTITFAVAPVATDVILADYRTA